MRFKLRHLLTGALSTSLFCSLLLFCFTPGEPEFLINGDQESNQSITAQFDSDTQVTRSRVVLVWTFFFGMLVESLLHVNCSCLVTSDRSVLSSADYVVFELWNTYADDLPDSKSAGQKWVAWTQDTPDNLRYWKRLDALRLVPRMDMVVSYWLKSDIYIPFGRIVRNERPHVLEPVPTKNRSVAWLVSHCRTASERELYVKELSKHIDVHVYGMCGKLRPTWTRQRFYRYFEQHYNFYLSFENSFCEDYVTEKFFGLLAYNIVPVVRGAVNYSAIVNSSAFINADDFDSPAALAQHLRAVQSDAVRYNSHFRWKTHSAAQQHRFMDSVCSLCMYNHNGRTRINEFVATCKGRRGINNLKTT